MPNCSEEVRGGVRNVNAAPAGLVSRPSTCFLFQQCKRVSLWFAYSTILHKLIPHQQLNAKFLVPGLFLTMWPVMWSHSLQCLLLRRMVCCDYTLNVALNWLWAAPCQTARQQSLRTSPVLERGESPMGSFSFPPYLLINSLCICLPFTLLHGLTHLKLMNCENIILV